MPLVFGIPVVVVLILWLAFTYNGFVKLSNLANEAWSGIDVQLKRRHDLIPLLVDTVKGYAAHEKQTFEQVVAARTRALDSAGVKERSDAENMLSGALKPMFALAEAYPDLKANKNFLDLQKSLSELEDQIQMARRYFNAVVRDFNIKCESFPSLIIAGLFRFQKKDFFQIAEPDKANVQIKL
jgi:LemA protein